jgi:hypothetical protein
MGKTKGKNKGIYITFDIISGENTPTPLFAGGSQKRVPTR